MTRHRCLERERQTDREIKFEVTILVTFLINIFFLIFYVNIQPSSSKNKNGIFQHQNQTVN